MTAARLHTTAEDARTHAVRTLLESEVDQCAGVRVGAWDLDRCWSEGDDASEIPRVHVCVVRCQCCHNFK